ncbi:hypothetical protein QAD02_010229 [Eretmocerus hayati]|uniref:Uncharacterized protein n=1 Tax=Eretmocerus hayati TaxID=131215 RepID=A0ACC2NC95_9HYME|nr:hypothetical protein QAD02_010229 [Eretmocerus hayati]
MISFLDPCEKREPDEIQQQPNILNPSSSGSSGSDTFSEYTYSEYDTLNECESEISSVNGGGKRCRIRVDHRVIAMRPESECIDYCESAFGSQTGKCIDDVCICVQPTLAGAVTDETDFDDLMPGPSRFFDMCPENFLQHGSHKFS